MLEPLLMTAAQLLTYQGEQVLTNASGFFFERDQRLFVVTCRHVLFNETTNHFPDRIEIELHVDPANLAESRRLSLPLYRDGKSAWRQGVDSGGEVDIAVLEADRTALPQTAVYHAFTPQHLQDPAETVEVGTSLLIVGFPLGFHDTLHHMPVVRQAAVASCFGLRFQGQGYFLTDARTHRGSSGAPVVMRAAGDAEGLGGLPWKLLGVHAARFDMGARDPDADEALGLNGAWYADILMTLTES